MNIETHEVLVAGTLIGVAQEALREALKMSLHGTHDQHAREQTRRAIRFASAAVDEAKLAVDREAQRAYQNDASFLEKNE